MIHTNTYAQLKTQQTGLKLLSSNIPTNTQTVSALGPTGTLPTGSNIVMADIFNYIKIVPMSTAANTGLTLRVVGWSALDKTSGYYVPHVLGWFDTFTLNSDATAITINTVSGFKAFKNFSAATTGSSTSNCKVIGSSSTGKESAVALIDTMGCVAIQFDYFCTNGGAANAGQIFYGFI